MKYFETNSAYYTPNLQSFTSSDEFSLNKRVHIGNEMPPIDLYDMAHSCLKNDFWKWFLGSSFISYDVNYNIESDGKEYFDKDGYFASASISKYINGIRAKDYGPTPYFEYSENGEKLVNPKYHRMEISGAFLPEIDFLLHEGYRYLSVLYPDHPRFTEILTTNEINDEISQAARIIDYNIDCPFFDWLAGYLVNTEGSLDLKSREQNEEALKLKVRNLTNHAFRRKYFGSKSGYLQFAADAYQHASVYPVAEYIPFSPQEARNELQTFKVFNEFEDLKPQFENRKINTFDPLYKKQFRLVDFTGESYDYENYSRPPLKVTGTAYSTPYSLSTLFEYSSSLEYLSPLTMYDDFFPGQKIFIGDVPAYINSITKESAYRPTISLIYDEDTGELDYERSQCKHVEIKEKVTRIETSVSSTPLFKTVSIYEGVEKTIEKNGVSEEYINIVNNDDSANSVVKSLKELYKNVDPKLTLKLTPNPYQAGSFYMPASMLLSFYEKDLVAKKNEEGVVYFSLENVLENKIIKEKDLVVTSFTNNSFVSEINGIENGYIDIKIQSPQRINQIAFEHIEAINESPSSLYAFVLELNKNRETLAGEKILIYGKPTFICSEELSHYQYEVLGLRIQILAVPEHKPIDLILQTSPAFKHTALDRFNALLELFPSPSNISDSSFRALANTSRALDSRFQNLEEEINTLISNRQNGDILSRELNSVKSLSSNVVTTLKPDYLKNDATQNNETFTNQLDALRLKDENKDAFIEACYQWLVTVKKHIDDSKEWMSLESATAKDRTFYQKHDPQNANEQLVKDTIISKDVLIDKQLVNKQNLLSPSPENASEEYNFSLINFLDFFNSTYSLGFDETRDTILFKKEPLLGEDGIIENYTFGSLNTISIVSKGENISVDESNFFSSTDKTQTYVKKYETNDIPFYAVNKDIYIINEKSTLKFSYATNAFLDCFLTETGNVQAEIIEKNKIEIRSICEEGSNIIQFVDQESIYRMVALSTGDQVTGGQVGNDTYITSINLEKSLIVLNKPLHSSGDFILTYLCDTRFIAKEKSFDNYFSYRNKLSDNSLLDNGSMVSHIYTKNELPSQTFLLGMRDSSQFKDILLRTLKDNTIFSSYFNRHVKLLYAQQEDHIVQPSLVNLRNSLFFEINAHKKYDDNFIMKKETLDYFQQSLSDLSRFSDNVNVGVSISGRTTTDNNVVEDEKINSTFKTHAWTLSTMPVYAEIGTGKIENDRFVYYEAVEENKYEPKSFWNYDVWDSTYTQSHYEIDEALSKALTARDSLKETLSELKEELSEEPDNYEIKKEIFKVIKNLRIASRLIRTLKSHEGNYISREDLWDQGIDMSKADRAFWFKKDFNFEKKELANVFYNVDKPVMRIKLGEYEVQRFLDLKNYLRKPLTTVQFSIIKRVFSNIQKEDVATINLVHANFFIHNIFKNVLPQITATPQEGMPLVPRENTLKLKHLGDWKPTAIKNEENRYVIDFPEIPDASEEVPYYTIAEKTQLSQITLEGGTKSTITYEAGTILVLEEGKWLHKSFTFIGLLGDFEKLRDFLRDVQIEDEDNYIYIRDSLEPDTEHTLLYSLMFKTLISIGLFKGKTPTNIKRLSENELKRIFEYAIKAIDIEEAKADFKSTFGDVPQSFPDSFKKNDETGEAFLTKDDIFWFNYTVGYKALETNGINPGDCIGLMWHDDEPRVIFLNENRFLFLLDAADKVGINTYEYNTFIGKNGKTEHTNPDFRNNILTFEKLEKYISGVQLSASNLLEGSVKLSFSTNPKFEVTGNIEPVDSKTNSKARSETRSSRDFEITKNPIYYDKEKESLFSYTEDGEKFTIDLEDNKYFKNAALVYGAYQRVGVASQNSFIYKSMLSPIEGVPFDLSAIGTSDKILQIEKINVRSRYDSSLEPQLFSSHYTLEAAFNGITFENEKPLLKIGYDYDSAPKVISNRLNFFSKVNELRPIALDLDENEVRYPDTIIHFDNSSWSNGLKINKPMIQKALVTREAGSGDTLDLIYYKNMLVLEGEIKTNEPDKISFKNNEQLADALEYVKVGDAINGIASISGNNLDLYQKINLKDDSFKIKLVDFKENVALFVDDTKIGFKYTPSLEALVGEEVEFDTIVDFSEVDEDWDEGCRILSVSQDKSKNSSWIISIEKNDGSQYLRSLSVTTNGFEVEEPGVPSSAYSNLGVTADSTSLVKINNDSFLMRDLSLTKEDISQSIKSLNDEEEWTQDELFVGEFTDEAIHLQAGSLTLTNGIHNSEDPYSEISFSISRASSNSGDLSMEVLSELSIEAAFEYLHNSSDWKELEDASILIKNVTNIMPKKVRIFFIEDSLSNDSNIFWHLPSINANEKAFVVFGESPQIKFSILDNDQNDSFIIENIQILDPIKAQTGRMIESKPTTSFSGSSINATASNSKGYQAIIRGGSLFLYSPTDIYDEEYGLTGVSEDFHWKKASLPSSIDATLASFKTMSFKEAYEKVKFQRETLIELLQNRLEDVEDESLENSYSRILEWLEDNDIKDHSKATSENELPDSFVLNDISFERTLEGTFPHFHEKNSGRSEEWKASSTSTRPENYLKYLVDYFTIICAGEEAVDFFNVEDFEEILLTDTQLVIQFSSKVATFDLNKATSRRNLEDVSNWTITTFDEALDFYVAGEFKERTVYIDGVKHEIDSFPPKKMKSLLTITSSFAEKKFLIYAGYVYSDESILEEAIPEDEDESGETLEYLKEFFPNNGEKIIYNKKYPAIFYSDDGGESFKKLSLTPSSGFPSISSYSENSGNFYGGGIHKVGDEIRVVLKKEDDTNFIQYVTFEINNTSSFDVSSAPSSFGDKEDNLKELAQSASAERQPQNEASGIVTCGENFFYIESPKSFQLPNQAISVIGSDYIKYTNVIEAFGGENDIVKVLISIDPSKLVESPHIYVKYESEYLDSFGYFKVPYIKRVDNILFTNRIYSPREVIFDEDMYGVPALREDVDKTVYEYYEGSEDSQDYVPFKNGEGQLIYLCDELGNFLKDFNLRDINPVFSLKDMIDLQIPATSLLQAPKLKEDFKFEIKIDSLTDLLRESDFNAFNSIDFSRTNPALFVESENSFEMIYDNSDLFYEWPSENGIPLEPEEIDAFFETDDGRISLEEEVDLAELARLIEEIDGSFGESNKFSERFTCRSLTKKDSTIFLIEDTLRGVVPFKEDLKIYLTASMPYNFAGGQTIIKNVPFRWKEDSNIIDSAFYDDDIKINGVYLPPKGYGGSIFNESFSDERPDQIDYQAFEHEKSDEKILKVLAKNEYDENIFLVDSSGNKLFSKAGLFWLSPEESTDITYDNLRDGKSVISFYKDLEKDTYGKKATQLNIFKRTPSPIEVYTPKSAVWFDGGEKNTATEKYETFLTLLRVHKAGVDISPDTLEKYTFTCKDENGKVIEFGENEHIRYDIESQSLKVETKNRIYDADITFEKVCVHIVDESGQEYIHELDAMEGEETAKVLEISNCIFNKGDFLDNNIIKVTFKEDTIKEKVVIVSPDLTEKTLDDESNEEFEIILKSFEEGLRHAELQTDNEAWKLFLDLRNYDLELLTPRDWVTDTESELKCCLYSGDQEVDQEVENGVMVFNPTEKTFQVDYKNITFKKDLKVINEDDIIQGVEFDKWIFTKADSEETYSFNYPDHKLLIDGLYGHVIFNKPKYESFKELLHTRDAVIYPLEKEIFEVEGTKKSIATISKDLSSLQFSDFIGREDDEINNGDTHFIRVKLLTINTIYPDVKYLNDLDTIHEVAPKDLQRYGFDRVWINEKSFLPPPIFKEGVMYNSSSLGSYSESKWLNKDGFKVYLSNEKGQVVEVVPNRDKTKIEYKVLGDPETGNCQNRIYGKVDPRHNLMRPFYTSVIELYKAEALIEGDEINPLVSHIAIEDEYNLKSKIFTQSAYVYTNKKSGHGSVRSSVKDSYISHVHRPVNYYYDYSKDEFVQGISDSYINYATGEIKMFVQGPDEDYFDQTHRILSGIRYKNSFNRNGIYNSYWKNGAVGLSNIVTASFYQNTTENILDKTDKDAGVVNITEMGLFDQYGKLCAYMTHPIVQYRSDSQHISYNLLIEEN